MEMLMKMKSNTSVLKVEVVLRILSILILVTTACLVGLDTETEVVFVPRKATVKDLYALQVLVIVESVAAGYHLLQLTRCFFMTVMFKKGSTVFNPKHAWFCFLLDQVVVYISFAANSAAGQASLLAITGADSFQWLKVCNIYTRFCFQIGGALFCGLVAAILMAVISSISAFNLFRHYSSKKFLVLKPLRH